jgi:lipid A ethanolaminephosphotransferase
MFLLRASKDLPAALGPGCVLAFAGQWWPRNQQGSIVHTAILDIIGYLNDARCRLRIGLLTFILCYALLNMVVFQGPALRIAISVTDLSNAAGWVTLASFEMLQLFLFFFLLYGLSLISVRLMLAVSVVLFVANSVAVYFITTYNVELDQSMIANILNTDPREAGGFTTPALVLGNLALLVFAVWAVTRFDIAAPRWPMRVLVWLGGIATFLAYVWAVSFTLLWFDQHAPRLGGKILPWSYVINTVRHVQQRAFDTRDITLLPDATFTAPVPAGQKDVVVLMIGESARRANSSMYSYARQTMPQARKHGMIALQGGVSCATNTIAAVSCILSFEGSDAPPVSNFEPLPSYLQRMGVETIVRLNNTGTPPMKVQEIQWASEVVATCTQNCPDAQSDAALLYNLGSRIAAAKSDRVFVILHVTGSHGPAYFKKYPPNFERFTPVCKSVQLADCTQDELVNAYDNSLLFTDHLLGAVIEQVAGLPNARSVVMYLSDHGQSLGENGFYLHGAPNTIAPKVQREIPVLLWLSPQFQMGRAINPAAIETGDVAAQDVPFHTVMGVFGMRSAIYKPQYDLFAPQTQP